MFIYNVTTNVSWAVHDAWMQWMLEEHIPAVLATNCFIKYQLLKLHEQDETEGPTYIVQYFAESKALYNRYIENFAPDFKKELTEKWGENIFVFRTLLEVLSLSPNLFPEERGFKTSE